MKRRQFLSLAGAGAVAWPRSAGAQPAPKAHRLFMLAANHLVYARMIEETLPELAKLGHVEGRNLAADRRNMAGDLNNLPGLVAEAVRLRPDVILTSGAPMALALKRATASIPIVFVLVADPIGTGVVPNLARPGGNITGISLLSAELAAKRLELLREAVPGMTRVAVLINPLNAGSAVTLSELQGIAGRLRIELAAAEVRSADQFETAFAQAARAGATGLIVLEDAIFTQSGKAISDLALKHRLPGAYGIGDFAQFGGLMTYSANTREICRRAAHFVGKIFKGASPADLPVEQPTRFELVVNLKTARALGITIPQSILVRADEVIE